MNRNLTILTALGAGLVLAPHAVAQAAAPAAQPAAPVAAPVAPQAIDAKIALVNFEQVVLATNEGQTVTAGTQKKYEPKKAEIERDQQELEALNKALQSAPATLSDADRATKLRELDLKQKHVNTEAEEASTAYNAEWQEAESKVAAKIITMTRTYAQQQGYTMLLDVSSQSSNVLWALPSTDISQAIVDLYNKQSGVAAPAPPTPSAPRPQAKPATPRPSTTAKPPAK